LLQSQASIVTNQQVTIIALLFGEYSFTPDCFGLTLQAACIATDFYYLRHLVAYTAKRAPIAVMLS
jgi:hypothetical protein